MGLIICIVLTVAAYATGFIVSLSTGDTFDAPVNALNAGLSALAFFVGLVLLVLCVRVDSESFWLRWLQHYLIHVSIGQRHERASEEALKAVAAPYLAGLAMLILGPVGVYVCLTTPLEGRHNGADRTICCAPSVGYDRAIAVSPDSRFVVLAARGELHWFQGGDRVQVAIIDLDNERLVKWGAGEPIGPNRYVLRKFTSDEPYQLVSLDANDKGLNVIMGYKGSLEGRTLYAVPIPQYIRADWVKSWSASALRSMAISRHWNQVETHCADSVFTSSDLRTHIEFGEAHKEIYDSVEDWWTTATILDTKTREVLRTLKLRRSVSAAERNYCNDERTRISVVDHARHADGTEAYSEPIKITGDEWTPISNREGTTWLLDGAGGLMFIHVKESQSVPPNAKVDVLPRAVRDPIAYTGHLRAQAAKEVVAGDYDKAIEDFTAVLRVMPHDAGAHNDRGNVYMIKDEYQRAIADFSEAITIQPKEGSPYFNRAIARSKNGGDQQGALEDISTAVALEPASIPPHFRRAQIYEALGNYESALRDYRTIATLEPKEIGDSEGRCAAAAYAGAALSSAEEQCSDAISRAPGIPDPVFFQALVFIRQGRMDEAHHDLEWIITNAPQAGASYLFRGLISIKWGDKANGERDIAHARELDPTLEKKFAYYGLL